MSQDALPLAAPLLPEDAHKGQAGRLLCLCGSPEMPGAALLTVRAAQRGGAGLVTLAVFQRELLGCFVGASPETTYLDLSRNQDLFAGRLPQPLTSLRQHARVVGPGLNKGGRTRELVRRLIEDEFEGPLLLDADALNVLAGVPELLKGTAGATVLTPHPGEAARLIEREVPPSDEGRLEVAQELAERSGAVCVLKGKRTVVCEGERHYINTTGGPGLASAGTGDVLSGLLGAYLARARVAKEPGWGAFEAACAAAWVHGRAGDLATDKRGVAGVVASDLLKHIPAAQQELARSTR